MHNYAASHQGWLSSNLTCSLCRLTTAASGLCAFLLTGCATNTLFDYAPQEPTSEVVSTLQAANAASFSVKAYEAWAKNISVTPQLFEVPIIGTAVGAVVAMAYGKPHPGPVASLAITGGALALLDNYYNPRARLKIYGASEVAMRCIERTAVPLIADERKSGSIVIGDEPFKFDYRSTQYTLSQLAEVAPDRQTQVALQNLSRLENEKAQMLAEAIDQVNSTALTRGVDASIPPDAAKIATDLKNAIQNAQNVKNQTDAARPGINAAVQRQLARALRVDAAAAAAIAANEPPPNPLDDLRVQKLQSLQSDISACVTQAG